MSLIEEDEGPSHRMTLKERESLKRFARQGVRLEQTLIMISNWMSCMQDVSFTAYAANWAVAVEPENENALKEQWPLTDRRMIADGETAWGSYLKRTS